MATKEMRMLLKVIKDSQRDKSREVCIIPALDGNIYRQYALLRGFKESVVSNAEYLVELNYDKNFNSEKPVKFNLLTPNGFLHPNANICIAQGTFHRGSKEFQQNRILAGYGLVRQLWALIQYLYAYDDMDTKECKNWKDSGVNGIGWVSTNERNPELAAQYAEESRAFNFDKYRKITEIIYKDYELDAKNSASSSSS